MIKWVGFLQHLAGAVAGLRQHGWRSLLSMSYGWIAEFARYIWGFFVLTERILLLRDVFDIM